MSQTAPQISALDREDSIEAISLVAVSRDTSSKRIFAYVKSSSLTRIRAGLVSPINSLTSVAAPSTSISNLLVRTNLFPCFS